MEEITFEPGLESWGSYTETRDISSKRISVCKGSRLTLGFIKLVYYLKVLSK